MNAEDEKSNTRKRILSNQEFKKITGDMREPNDKLEQITYCFNILLVFNDIRHDIPLCQSLRRMVVL